MSTMLGKLIYERRLEQGLTQDQFGKKYGVSGPAIFKFEKGFVNPSFKLWMKMAADLNIGEGLAVLLWAKAKLPAEYQDLLELKGAKVKEAEVVYKSSGKKVDFSRISNRDKLRNAVLEDKSVPTGLRNFVKDDEIWRIYEPTGREINLLRESYAKFGDGNKAKYREGLRTLRDFTGKEG